MKLRIKYGSWMVRKGYTAWVLYPFMIFRAKKAGVSDVLFRHELEHVYQVRRDGWLVFYVKYLYYLARYGYLKNPYEMDAREAETQPLTTVEKGLKDKV